MTELKYDPELPFAVIIREDGDDYTLLGRCSRRHYAEDLVRGGTILRTIVDTTPKPKIPEDAEFILWVIDGETNMAYREGGEWYGSDEWWTEEDLSLAVEDAEVTVLVRKDES